jgi:hypothetical protein
VPEKDIAMTENTEPQYPTLSEKPCLICGNADFTWGIPLAGSNETNTYIYFRPSGSKWEDGDIPLAARLCP